MKRARNIAVFAALAWILIKLGIYSAGMSREWYVIVIMANMLALLVVIFLCLHFSRKDQESNQPTFIDDFKGAMRGGLIYSLLIFVFLLAYYSGIDKEFGEQRKAELIESVENMDYEAMQDADPIQTAQYSRDDAIAQMKSQADTVYSPFFMSTVALFGMFILSLFYSLLLSVFFRRVLVKFR